MNFLRGLDFDYRVCLVQLQQGKISAAAAQDHRESLDAEISVVVAAYGATPGLLLLQRELTDLIAKRRSEEELRSSSFHRSLPNGQKQNGAR